MLLLILSILSALCAVINAQTAQLYNIYYPSENDTILQIQMSFDNEESEFVVNMQIVGDHWAALGFANSGENVGEMYGVDAWIYGDFGAPNEQVWEYALGDHEIGTVDAQQNLDYSIYSQGDTVQVHIERALDTGTRDDYVIVEGGTLCILWALGVGLQVETGHNASTRGMECFELAGTTQPPTPPPSWYPTKAPTFVPTTRPTRPPTTDGGTFPPSFDPTPRPTNEPTTAEPSERPTSVPTGVPGSPTGIPTARPTNKPTDIPGAPTSYPTDGPTPEPTPVFNDDEPTDAPKEEDANVDDAFEAWTWIIIAALAALVLCLLAAIVFCYVRNRRIRQQRNKEKEEAYEELENYRAKHGLDIPDKTPNKYDKDDDDLEAGVGNVAKSGAVPDNDVNSDKGSSDDDDDNDEDKDKVNMSDVAPPPAYAPPTVGGRKGGRGPKRPPRNRPAYRTKELTVDDDDDVVQDMNATPGGPARPGNETTDDENDAPTAASKFVDPEKERRERIRKERDKRVAERAKLAQNQASESAERDKRLKDQRSNSNQKKQRNNNNNDDDDDYDYEAARREREERRKRRAQQRQRQKKKAGKFGVFDEDNW